MTEKFDGRLIDGQKRKGWSRERTREKWDERYWL